MEWRILGPLEVVSEDAQLDVGGPKQRALLALLLIEARRVVSLDRLIDELWPSAPPARATATIQVYISNLRRVLEPDRSPRAPARVLLTRPPGYVLSIEQSDVDATLFERLAEEGRCQLDTQPARAKTALTRALGLWRGPALADFAAEPFARIEAARLEVLRVGALEDRFQAELNLGRHHEVVAELEATLADHPFRERLWEMLMLAQYRSGLQRDALRTFERARRHLGEELGIVPGPGLRNMESAILAQSSAIDWHPPHPDPSPSALRSKASAPRAGGDPEARHQPTRLVGRKEHLAALTRVLNEARTGRGRLVLVSGEPGVGKTRLAQAFASRAMEVGATVVWGRCVGGGDTPPFLPWAEALRALLAAPDQLVPEPGSEARSLALVVPELRDTTAPTTAPPADPAQARFEACAGVIRMLIRRATPPAVVVILDDLHWADPPSLQLLGLLAARMANARLLVLATYRDTEINSDECVLFQTLAGLAREPVVERMPLRGLPVDDVSSFIAETTGVVPPTALVEVLHTRTDGNPFFLVELVRLLHSQGALTGVAAAPPELVPPGVRDVIRLRLARLPEQTNALLSVGAVAGPHFDHRVLEVVGGLDEERTLCLMEAAIITGIVNEDLDVVGRYQFSHPLVRQTIYEGLSGVRRARLHARVAEALEGLKGRTAIGDVAHHLWQARTEVEAARILSRVLEAAEAALASLAYEQAIEQLERAVALLATMPANVENIRHEFTAQLRLAQLLAMTRGSRVPETERALSRARELTARVGDDRDMLAPLWGLFFTLQLRGEIEAGSELAEQLLTAAARGDSMFELAGHLALGINLYLRGQFCDAHEHLQHATAAAYGFADCAALVTSFQMDPRALAGAIDAHVVALRGDHDAAAKLARDAVECAVRLGDPLGAAIAGVVSCLCGLVAEDVAVVEEMAQWTRDRCSEGGFRGLDAMALSAQAWVAARRGRPTDGAALARAGLTQLRDTGTRWGISYLVVTLAEVATDREDQEEALVLVEQSLAVAESGGEQCLTAELHRHRAELLAELHPDRRTEAVEAARRAIAVATSRGATALERRALETLSRLTQRAGREAQARSRPSS